jgi:hypothetical protein
MKQRLDVPRLAALALGIFAAVGQPQIAARAETFQPAKSPSPDPTGQVDAVKPADGLAQPPFTLQYESHLTVRQDRTATEISTKRIKILTRNAVQTLSQQQLQFVEGMQKIETVEAFTEKSDGRRIPVEPANVITRDGASGLQATYVPDLKVRTIIFPDVSVGDTLVMTNKAEILQDVFPGQFTDSDIFPRSQSLSSVQVTIEAPDTIDLAVRATGNGATDKVELVDGVRRHSITIVPEPYEPEEPGAVSALDREPALLVSTFRSYGELGKAYGDAAFPKTQVTPEIAALAAEITKNIDGRLAQAVAIDAWMKKNIRYVAVYLSIGRVVPHEAAAVLHNKFGDCKDKVTLMMALLAAKGIASEAALINLGAAYTLPEPPTLAALNHVILYVPEFDLYDDPTANNAAFGVLAPETYDKPVVRVSATEAKLARTPAMKHEEHRAHSLTTIEIAANGAISGRTNEDNIGILGSTLRFAAGVVQQVGDEKLAQRQLQAVNTPGTGHIDLGNSADTVDPVKLNSSFTLYSRFKPPGPGGFVALPVGLALTARPGAFTFGPRLSGRKTAFVCYAGIQTEDIETTFDKALPLPALPAASHIENPLFTYSSTFQIENRTFKIHREFVSRVASESCPPEAEARIAADLERVRADVNAAYRFSSPVPPTPAVTQPTDAKRTTGAGQKSLVDFLGALNVDCSSKGVTAVTVMQPPQHGKVTIDQGTWTSDFPQSNPRFECNKRQSDGALVSYEPAPGFTGADVMTLDIHFPDAAPFRKRYSITVNPARGATPAPPVSPTPSPSPPNSNSGPPKILEQSRVVLADQRLRVAFLYDLNPDCSLIGIPTVRILEPPKSGQATVEKDSGFPSFSATNVRSICNGDRVDGAAISYMPNVGYTGTESITVEIIYPDGTDSKRHYSIEVK